MRTMSTVIKYDITLAFVEDRLKTKSNSIIVMIGTEAKNHPL